MRWRRREPTPGGAGGAVGADAPGRAAVHLEKGRMLAELATASMPPRGRGPGVLRVGNDLKRKHENHRDHPDPARSRTLGRQALLQNVDGESRRSCTCLVDSGRRARRTHSSSRRC